jgi:preprotein translocase subunit SecB
MATFSEKHPDISSESQVNGIDPDATKEGAPQMTHPKTEKGPPSLVIQRIYIKDVSFESPNAPEIFQKRYTPDLDLHLNIKARALGEEMHEVELQVTIKANTTQTKSEAAQPLFIAELKQAGIFNVQGVESKQLKPLLHIACPTILYPYASALISDLVMRATFMPLHLSPVNFEALYAQHEKAKQDGQTGQ